jgi:hypothetical protein
MFDLEREIENGLRGLAVLAAMGRALRDKGV